MEKKYYTPELEEFYVGFEFESKRGAYDGTVKTKEQFDSEQWQYDFCSEGDFVYIERALTGTNAKNGLCHLRVRYLDREDIESLGFDHDSTVEGESFFIKGNMIDGEIRLVFRPEDMHNVDIESEIGAGDFYGTIKNKSELKKLLKQLGI